MFMGLQQRWAAKRTYRSYVDLSKFTGMEVEHKHDTESAIPVERELNVHPASIEKFTQKVGKEYGQLAKHAHK